MKSLTRFSDLDTNRSFIFFQGSPDLPQKVEKSPEEKKKEQYEKALKTVQEAFEEHNSENRKAKITELKKLQEKPGEKTSGEIDMLIQMYEQDIPDEYEYFTFIENTSLITPKKEMSWKELVQESNTLNSAKKTVQESSIDTPNIYNFLQTGQNVQKVAQYLESKFGLLRMTDRVGIWFNDKSKQTEIYFQREGESKHSIPFRNIE